MKLLPARTIVMLSEQHIAQPCEDWFVSVIWDLGSQMRTLVGGFPACDLLLHPLRAFFAVAHETRVGAFGLPKPLGHIRIRNIVNLMRARAEQKRIHDARHMAGDALAGFRAAGMMRMRGELRLILELRMAAGAHLVGIVAKLQSGGVRRFIVNMWIVAGPATRLPFLEAFRALQRFHDESGLAETAVFVEAFPRKFAERESSDCA